MKTKDIAAIIIFGFVAAIISFMVANAVFKPPAGSTQVPVISPIDPDFPDVSSDSNYSAIFNKNALDPTQPIQIGNQNNKIPFR